MKLARLAVRLPIDDALPIDRLLTHVRALLEERGTEVLTLDSPPPVEGETNGEADALLPGTPAKSGRIHWPAIEVVQQSERAPPQPSGKTKSGGTR